MVRMTASEVLRLLGEATADLRVVPPIPDGSEIVVDAAADDAEVAEATEEVLPRDPSPRDGERLSLALFIHYRNAEGVCSARRITVHQVVGNPPTNLLAYCHERRQSRNFRIDRLTEIANPETGEVLETGELLQLLSRKGVRAVDPLARAMVNILVFMAGCDGWASPEEAATIDDMIASWCLRFDDAGDSCSALQDLARRVAPDSEDLMIGLRSFAAQTDRDRYGPWLRRAIDAVVSADEVHSVQEFEWLVRIHDLLTLMGKPRKG